MSIRFDFVILFLAVYAVYHLCLITSVPGGDSGELLAESCVLGTPHPPGYPLFTMMSHEAGLFHFPRFFLTGELRIAVDWNASKAWQVNNLCAIFGALASVFIYASAVEVVKSSKLATNGRRIMLLGAFLFAFTPLVWEYSTTAEVFALNSMLCAALIYLACKVYTSIQAWMTAAAVDNEEKAAAKIDRALTLVSWYTMIGAFTSGLALSNQHASLLEASFLIPYIIAILYTYKVPNALFIIIKAGVCFVFGLLPYIYLPLASQTPTPGSWGDLTTLTGFLRHVMRAEYGTFQLGVIQGRETAAERIVIYLAHASAESYHVLFPIIILGAVASRVLPVVSAAVSVAKVGENNKDVSTTKSAVSVSGVNNSAGSKMNHKSKSGKASKSYSSHISSISTAAATVAAKKNTYEANHHLLVMLASLWLFYTLIWHCVLSNLPLSSPMPFAVHSRFWMQPNIALYVIASVCLCYLWTALTALLFAPLTATATSATANAKTTLLSSPSVSTGVEMAVTVLVFNAIIHHRFATQDRSKSGIVMRQYGSLALASLPPQSLLLSHTDLDWNPIRYLRLCEGMRRDDVTHLSFQLMPYPWFNHKQSHFYPNVRFPADAFDLRVVSTDRHSEGNANMIRKFLAANGADKITTNTITGNKHFPGGIFIDMQAFNEAEIDAQSAWRGLYLIPWGTLYRVYSGKLTSMELTSLHHTSAQQLRSLVAGFPTINESFIRQYPAGTWEFAAASVYHDAHYQLGLHLLTYAIDLQKDISMDNLPLLLDRLLYASILLRQALHGTLAFGTISSQVPDVHKNTALSALRLHGILTIISQYQAATVKQFNKQKTERQDYFLDGQAVSQLLTADGIASAQDTIIETIGGFVAAYPNDRDVNTFRSTLNQLRAIRGGK